MGALDTYRAKRRFGDTPEPDGSAAGMKRSGKVPIFVVQKHAATRLHWDFRLEWEGVLLSWAVTRGPSTDMTAKRLAVRTEDHPLDYAEFEGTIAKGNYGAGTVMLWDRGTWAPMPGTDFAEGLAEGKLKVVLAGERMIGAWTLIRMRPRDAADAKRENWLLIKERDDTATDEPEAMVETFVTSVTTGRTMDEIAAGLPATQTAKPAKPATKPARRARSRQTLPRPGFVKPQLATLVSEPPEGDAWWHEAKLDGYRCQIALGDGGVTLYSRSGADWTDRFGPLAEPALALPCRSALIDGEAIAPDGGFAELQASLKTGGPLTFVAFDLLHLDGTDLRARPLSKRREALERLFSNPPPALRISPKIDREGTEALKRLCAAGGEGVVAKRADSAYRSGRTDSWRKIKCRRESEFVIVGHAPSTSASRPFASILLATREDGTLLYRGKVGSGFDAATLDDLSRRFEWLSVAAAPLEHPPAETRGARWLRPELVAQVRFAEFTGDGRIRHGIFQGLREDKPAAEVAAEDAPVVFRGQRISSPERIVFPDAGLTKADVARYYDRIADRMLPHLRNRALSLVRHPEGITKEGFFQKHRGAGFPDALREREVSGEPVMLIDTAEGIVAGAQVGAIEFHIRGSRVDRPDQPDRMVFDLDPDPSVGFPEVVRAAVDIRDRLAELGLPSWAMVTGGKGVHVVVPLRRTASVETVELFARLFSLGLVEREPARFTATLAKKARVGRIFVDWLRNQRKSTAVCPWSLRARPDARVAVPVTWGELMDLPSANAFRPEDALAHPPLTEPAAASITAAVVERLSKG